MAPLKVCMVVHQYYHRDGRVRRYSESLARLGHHVDILCLRDPQRASTETIDNVRVHTIPLNREYGDKRSYFREYFIAMILFTIFLFRLYTSKRYHVIHVHNMPDFLVFSALLPRLFGAKLILDIHDPMPEFYISKFESDSGQRFITVLKAQERLSILLAHVVITANANFKENLLARKNPPEKIAVISNLPDEKLFDRSRYHAQHSKDSGNFVLIYPGTIAPRYGLDIAIRAMPLLVKAIPGIRLRIIGHCVDYVSTLTELAASHNVSHQVEFLPTVPINEIPKCMSEADIGIYPALPDVHMNIATPSKVLEYAFMGLPIVASRLKVLEDLFTESSVMFFAPGDETQFADCVLRLFNNPALRQQLVENCDDNFVKRHSWHNEFSKYTQILDKIVHNSVVES